MLAAMRGRLTHSTELTYTIIGLAMKIHRVLGPGPLENVYHRCLCHELRAAGIAFEREVPIPITYEVVAIDTAYRADIIVSGEVILEIKSVERLGPLHEAQLLTYLRLARCRVGLLLNFNTLSLTDGIRRMVA